MLVFFLKLFCSWSATSNAFHPKSLERTILIRIHLKARREEESSLDSFMLVPNRSILEVTNSFLRFTAPTTTSIQNNRLATDINNSITENSLLMSSSSTTPAVVATVAAAAATSAVIGLIAGYYYRSIASIGHRDFKTLKAPAALLKSTYGEELKLAVRLAMEGTLLMWNEKEVCCGDEYGKLGAARCIQSVERIRT